MDEPPEVVLLLNFLILCEVVLMSEAVGIVQEFLVFRGRLSFQSNSTLSLDYDSWSLCRR